MIGIYGAHIGCWAKYLDIKWRLTGVRSVIEKKREGQEVSAFLELTHPETLEVEMVELKPLLLVSFETNLLLRPFSDLTNTEAECLCGILGKEFKLKQVLVKPGSSNSIVVEMYNKETERIDHLVFDKGRIGYNSGIQNGMSAAVSIFVTAATVYMASIGFDPYNLVAMRLAAFLK